MVNINKKNGKLAYMFFLLVYCLSASEWELPGSSILRWVVISLLAFTGIMHKVTKNKNVGLDMGPYQYLFVAYVLGFLVSDANLSIGFQRALSFFVLIFGSYLYFEREGTSSQDIINSFSIFSTFLCTLMVALCGFYSAGNGGGFGNFQGIYDNKNYLVSVSCTAVCAGIHLVLNAGKFKKLLSVFGLACAVFITVATGSRAGIVCMAITFLSLPFVIMEAGSLKKKTGLVFLLLIVIVIMYFVAKNSNIPALERLLSDDGTSATGFGRTDTWAAGFDIFKKHPILGYGNSATYYYTFISEVHGWGVHSSYVTILIDHGILGTLLHVLFVGSFIINVYKRHIQICFTPTERRYIKLLYVLCVMLLANAASESFLFSVGNIASICFWINMVFIDLFLKYKLEEKVPLGTGEIL